MITPRSSHLLGVLRRTKLFNLNSPQLIPVFADKRYRTQLLLLSRAGGLIVNRKFISTIIIFVSLFITGQAMATVKIDPYLSNLKNRAPMKALKLSSTSSQNQVEEEMVSIFIKSNDPEITAEKIQKLDGEVNTIIGQIITAKVLPSSLQKIADEGEVLFIEGGKPIKSSNDIAGSEVSVGEAHSGTNLPEGYKGSGVIVGIIDTGIDYNHADFMDADGNSRILSIWDQKRRGGPSPSEIQNSYGTECDSESIIDGSCPMFDRDGHGTHVAGTAAGSDPTYGGVAPDANIIVVSYDSSLDLGSGYADTIFSTNICQAAYYVFEKASELGMPAVVNLSLGTHIGPHDGTSLFEECLSGLVDGAAGRAIVAAAGNEYSTDTYYTGIHAGFEVNGNTSATNFVIRKRSRDSVYYIDIWGTPGSDLSIGLALHEGRPSGSPMDFSEMTNPGDTNDGSFLDGDILYKINATETSSALNGKPHIGIRITLAPDLTDPSDYSFDLVVNGTGSFDAWLFPDKPAKTVQFTEASGDKSGDWNYVAGDSKKSVAMPSTAANIISVAGYTSRNRWGGGPGCCEVAYELGAILNFSSSGPSADLSATGFKPDIAAPGGMIASTLSSTSTPNNLLIMEDGKHVLQAGTSMATPFVTGTIALMFSANPNYTSEDVKRYVIESAYSDDLTGDVPNLRWGHGKLDVLRALEFAINGGASGSFDANGNITQPENASGGGSGCHLLSGGNEKTSVGFALLIILTLITITVRREKVLERIKRR